MDDELPLPTEGLSDLNGPDRQARGTTRRAKNVSELDPVDLTVGGISQRAGQIKHTAAALVADTKVSLLCDVAYDNPSHTFVNLASAACTVEWSSSGANRAQAYAAVHDDFGNHYYVDGTAGLVKTNASGRQAWRISLPAPEKNSIVRALAVDVDGRIFAGVSAGVEPENARIWCYEPREENKPPELLWTLQPGWLTEELHIDGATLQASQNDPIGHFSRMALYSGLGLNEPTLIREWEIPYPVNGHHFSPTDGSIFTAHQPDSERTRTPRSPETTGSREDWTIKDLDHYADRVWAWVAGDDINGGGLGNDGDYVAGDEAPVLVDKTGNGRGFVANTPDTGPTVRVGGIAGRDSVYFNGTSHSMVSEAPVTIEQQFRSINRSFLPSYTKAQFVLFMVVRMPQEATERYLLGRADTTTTNLALVQNSGARSGGFFSAPGTVSCYENGSFAVGSGPAGTQLPGGFDNSGLALITWIHDGGYDDVVGIPTRSTYRVNGRPCDRWTSDKIFASLKKTFLGQFPPTSSAEFGTMGRFRGDFCEAVVLSDWYVGGFAETSALAQQKLVTTPTYPTGAWAADGDTELERIEGWLAHKWGLAHKLPTGQAGVLESVTTPNNNDTVTIATSTYTWKTTLTVAALDVLIGGSAAVAFLNLHRAINGGGTPGTDYSAATVPHPTVFSPAALFSTDATPHVGVLVQRRDPRVFATFATTESSGAARQRWVNLTTSVTALFDPGLNTGHYPHSFYLMRAMGVTGAGTPVSRGGPPRSNPIGVTFPSVIGALISPYGMLVKWDPANGRARNVLTTDGPGYSFLPVGGVGYGVRVGSDGSVFSIGPRQAAVSGVIASPEDIDVRKLWDKGAEDTTTGGFVTTRGATALTAWEATPGAQTYAYPRMDLDEWDNVYVPTFQGSAGTSLAVYAKLGTGAGTPNADALLTLQSLADDPRAHAVSIDPESPRFPNAYVKPRAERVLLVTERATAANLLTLHMVRIVSATLSNLPAYATRMFAGVGASLYDITTPASPALVSAAAFDVNTRFIDWCEAFGKLFFVDGNAPKFYDPFTSLLGAWRARSSGEIPKRPQFIARSANRIFLGGFKDFPERAVACTAGDAFGWDFDPPGESPLATAAWRSDLSPLGDSPDVMTGMMAARDDLLYILGARNVFLVRGDPLQGGRFDQVTKGVGGAYGRASCVTPDGRFWWITNEAELYFMPIGASEGYARNVSFSISKRLQDAIDFSVSRPELVYDPRMKRLHVYLFPVGVGNTLVRHFVVSLLGQQPRFWEESYGLAGIQPTAAYVRDGDTGNDRRMLYGSRDGYVREWSASAASDDGTRIDSEFLIGPLHDPASGDEAIVENVRVQLARAQGGARVELYATDEPEDLGDAVDSASLLPGRNTPSVRASGAYLGLLVTGETGLERFSLRRIEADVTLTGPVRSRGR